MARGDESFAAAPRFGAGTIDLAARAAAHHARSDAQELGTRTFRVMQDVMTGALDDIDADICDVARVVVPAVGRGENGSCLPELMGVAVERTTWDYARRVHDDHRRPGDHQHPVTSRQERPPDD
ncbi:MULTISPECIES: hypothetical protein [unclassified Streptomyces]|uniref:hypothetical protein n=1 Tax=unclassified Streptomyces TaxID=2593676 RepID=UPI0011A43C33|nr:hypothetical protein [Streptomyces sp. BK340]TVZ80506.1 hypothetical protein FB157_12995 [Streptomyces sp. BK340]